MTVIICLSDGGGMLFNKRRQSRDRNMISDLVGLLGSNTLKISGFSLRYITESGVKAVALDNPLSVCNKGDFVFVENMRLSPYMDKISRLVIYKWNKVYPTDFKLDVDPFSLGFRITSSVDFSGYSHDKITREIWERRP